MRFMGRLLDFPGVDASEGGREVDADFCDGASTCLPFDGVAFLVDLSQGLAGIGVELELEDVGPPRGMRHNVAATGG